MPAVRAAIGFAPTARNWKPSVLASSSHHDERPRRATREDQAGVDADAAAEQGRAAARCLITGFEIAWPYGGAWNPVTDSR